MRRIREIKEDEIVDVAVLNDNFSALEGKKADRTTQHPVILLATNWTGESAPYTYTIELEEITADNTITLVPAEDITAEQYTALQSAQIEDAEQTAGTIILQAQHKLAIDIPILVLIGDTSVPSDGGGATIPLINHLLTEKAGVGALDAYQGMILDKKIEEVNGKFGVEIIRNGNPNDVQVNGKLRMFNASGDIPFGTQGDNDFLLDTTIIGEDKIGNQIAYNMRSDEIKFRRFYNDVWQTWKKLSIS